MKQMIVLASDLLSGEASSVSNACLIIVSN
jgi:hypothetical protein